MRTEDLKTFADIGKSIWADPAVSKRNTIETLSAVTLLNLTEERALERAAVVILERAGREGMARNANANFSRISQPFYRLSPEERFLLVALHFGRWSYARLGRIFAQLSGDSNPSTEASWTERIEELAWNARVQLASYRFPTYPAGAKAATSRCPEYNPQRPWTQRFMDEEFHDGSQRLFLQNHLMACDSCRETLNRCREVYFAVESLVPHSEDPDIVKNLETVSRRSFLFKAPTERTFLETLAIFVRRPDVQWVLAALGAMILLRIFK